jgi:hypothetical protein
MEEIKVYEVNIVDTEFEIHTKGPKSLKDYLKDKIDQRTWSKKSKNPLT